MNMLDGLLMEQVCDDAQIEGMLTSYDGKPAFFYQKSPPDSDGRWNKPCYPRVDYNVDMQYSPERKTSGTLTINIWCSSESEAMPEDIEKRLRELIGGTFYSVHGQTAVCAVWNRSDVFSFESNGNLKNYGEPEIFGATLMFELMEFPVQITTDPDPIQGINDWTKEYFPKLTVIAHDILPPVWKPTDEYPAVYWRFIGSDTDRQSYAAVWFTGQFAAHVIADSVTERNRWLKAIAECLRADGEIVMHDGSPMLVKQAQIRHGADPLREGQLMFWGQYGVLFRYRKEHAEIILNNANYETEAEKMAKTAESKEKAHGEQTDGGIKIDGSVYSNEELACAARKIFGVPPEIVRTALKQAGKKKAAVEEAKVIVNKFLLREVK